MPNNLREWHNALLKQLKNNPRSKYIHAFEVIAYLAMASALTISAVWMILVIAHSTRNNHLLLPLISFGFAATMAWARLLITLRNRPR